ncbi:MAG: RDD family protein [Actinobacteria bacterium]|nr:RDD family protein [Actinomycetota bacterium]
MSPVPETPGPVARLAAASLDLVVIVAWAGFAGLIGAALQSRNSLPETAGARDLLAFLTLVLPVAITFSLQEAGNHRATFGKRRMKSSVATTDRRRLSLGRSLLRNGLKLLPWQIAHTGVFHLAAGSTAPFHLALTIGAQLLAATDVVVMIGNRDHRACTI